jgi:hypothetical protein
VRLVSLASLLVIVALAQGCGGPDCAAPEHGSCTRDFEHHGADDLRFMEWLVGRWRAEDADGRVHFERWSPPTGGIMLGYARAFRDERSLGTEILRIEKRRDGITLTAHPEMQMPGTPFTLRNLRRARHGELRFENPDHDFPTRLVYRRSGPGEMLVRVENDEHGFTRRYQRLTERESTGAQRL